MKDYLSLVYLADKDYIAARLLNFCGMTLYPQAAYHSQQCVEKLLKALILQKGEKFPKEHKLNKLRSICERLYKNLFDTKTSDLINEFDIPEQVSRYGPYADYDPEAKKVPGKFQTKGVFIWQDTNIKNLDYIVYMLRDEIEFGKEDTGDNLRAVLNENKKNILVEGWKLKYFTIKDVLTSHNDYFK